VPSPALEESARCGVALWGGPRKHPKPRPNDSMGVKKAQVAFAQVSTASMGKVGGF
jgi:hypothetical protein